MNMKKALFCAASLFLIIAGSVLAEEKMSSANTPRQKGLEYAAKGKFNEAEVEFKKAVAEDKSDNTSQSALGVIKDFKDNKINEAYTLYLFQGLNHLQNGGTKDAISELQKAIKISPDYPRAYNILGVVFASEGEYEEAMDYFKKALEIDPGYLEACYNIAAAYQVTGKPEEAITYYNKVAEKEPSSFDVQMNLGSIYASMEKYQEALSYYQKAQGINGSSPLVYYSLGLVYFMTEQYDKSEENFRTAKALFQQDGDSEGLGATENYLLKISAIKTPQENKEGQPSE